MRIAFFTDTYLPSQDGIVRSIESFRDGLTGLGHEVFVFAPRPARATIQSVAPANTFMLPSLPTPVDNRRIGLASASAIGQTMRKLEVDLVHIHYMATVGFLGFRVAAANQLPLVSTWHTDLYNYIDHYPRLAPYILVASTAALIQAPLGPGKRRAVKSVLAPRRDSRAWCKDIVQAMATAMHNTCDAVIAPSTKAREQLLSWGTKPPVIVLPTGVNPPPPLGTLDAVRSVRRKYGLRSSYPVILYVGRLAPEKNIGLLLESLVYVLHIYPSARLVLAGDHKQSCEMRELARTLRISSAVVFTGWVDHQEIGALYAVATLFAFPSLTDTQAIVLQEASLSGLATVFVDAELQDIVKDGVGGVLARADAKSVARNIVVLAADPHKRTRLANAGSRAAAHFTVEAQSRHLEDIYRSILGSKTRRSTD